MMWDPDTIRERRSIKTADFGFREAMTARKIMFKDVEVCEPTSRELHAAATAAKMAAAD